MARQGLQHEELDREQQAHEHARRVAEVLGFLGATISFLCSQSGQFARFEEMPTDQAARAFQLVERLDAPWSPLNWAGRGVVAIGQGDWLSGLGLESKWGDEAYARLDTVVVPS